MFKFNKSHFKNAIYACLTCVLRKTNKQRIAALKKRVQSQSIEDTLGEALHELRYCEGDECHFRLVITVCQEKETSYSVM